MKKLFTSFFLIALLFAAGSARAEMTDFPRIKLRTLDKTTARAMTFEARTGSTVKFGSIYIKVQSCRKSDPMDAPESAGFLQIWEVAPKSDAKWIFSGWMFASSPALSPMDHPVYDVWVLDCLDDEKPESEAPAVPEAEAIPEREQEAQPGEVE